MLDDLPDIGDPYTLEANEGLSFIGVYVMGTGFVLSPEKAQELLESNEENQDVLFPYLGGSDLNQRPDQSPSRWVINFFDWELEQAERYPQALSILREEVYPQRMAQKDEYGRDYWWRHFRNRPELYQTITTLTRVLVLARVSRTVAFAFMPTDIVYSDATVVFALDQAGHFAVLQSTYHIEWAWHYSSTMKQDLRYSPTDVFENFPFPEYMIGLETVGEEYHETRRQIMLDRQEGLTDTYNRFHNPHERAEDIAHLRDLHVQMDTAVAAAYGWDDLDLGHGFRETLQGERYTISDAARREVLTRLLKLNHQRHAEELLAAERANLSDPDGADALRTSKGDSTGQMGFGDTVDDQDEG
jgi:hypothetical protein